MGDINSLKNASTITTIQSLADRPTLGTTNALKAKFDESPEAQRQLINNLIDYLKKSSAADDGASNIGMNSPYGATVKAVIEYILSLGVGGLPPDDSITLAKQNSTVKTGLLADLSTTIKTSVVAAINEVVTNLGTASNSISTVSGNLSTHISDTTKHITALTTQGDLLYHDGNNPTRLAKGTARKALAMDSTGTVPSWQESPQSLMTAAGDLLYASGANTPAKLAIDADTTKVLGISGGVPAWVEKIQSARVTGNDTSTSVAGNGTLTKTIALGINAKQATVIIKNEDSATVWQMITVDASGYTTRLGQKGSYSQPGLAAYFNATGLGERITISAASLSGTNLSITFSNSNGSATTLTASWTVSAI